MKLSYILLIPLLINTAYARKSTIKILPNSSLGFENSDSPSIVTYKSENNYVARIILFKPANSELYGDSLSFAFGFYCNLKDTGCILAIMILELDRLDRAPQLVWMANRDSLVKENATLYATPDGGLTLVDFNGTKVWSTLNLPSLVNKIELKHDGNLVLFGKENSNIWKSFNKPTNTLLMGQIFKGNKKLVSSQTHTNVTKGKFMLVAMPGSLTAFVRHKIPVAYTRLPLNLGNYGVLDHAVFDSGNISFFYERAKQQIHVQEKLGNGSSVQLLRLDPDGGIRVYKWQTENGWQGTNYTFGQYDPCLNPSVCGNYGVCSNGQCLCPVAADGTSYFKFKRPTIPRKGCEYIDMLNVKNYKTRLVDFGNLSYFSYFDPTVAEKGITALESCKVECRNRKSCKAAFFKYGNGESNGLCYLPTMILSMRMQPIEGDASKSVVFLKVRNLLNPKKESSSSKHKISAIVVSVIVFVAMLCFLIWRIKRRRYQVTDCYDSVFGAPVRFSHKELSVATGKFSKRLGRGGFGTVYKGVLKDGTEIAVKRLDCVEQQMDEFIAEMKTVGSIHHVHLVKLIGYCAEKSERSLVYQFMKNGSLDNWIFQKDAKKILSWETRRRIILEVAKGLAYLHEECNERIAHLDVKPHNILLDENFNAKISDFGLARFIGRSQSHLVTGMKGTFGYLAPEWQHLKITVKADIYSFGVVLLETICGRMVLDYTLDRNEMHLLRVLERKAKEDRIIDIVDKDIDGWDMNQADILKITNIAVWCLNGDPNKRPLMSTVVKILEGTMEYESLDFNFDNELVLSDIKEENYSNWVTQPNHDDEPFSGQNEPVDFLTIA